jgi:hypothetical protein
VDAGDLESLVEIERRQQRGHAPREHRLAAAGRAAQQQRVSARGRHRERRLRAFLAAHLA